MLFLRNTAQTLKDRQFESKRREWYTIQILSIKKLMQLLSDKVDFKTRSISRDKEGELIILRGPLHQEDIIILNVYIPNYRSSKYTRQKWTELKRETDKSIIIGEYFDIPHGNECNK